MNATEFINITRASPGQLWRGRSGKIYRVRKIMPKRTVVVVTDEDARVPSPIVVPMKAFETFELMED